MIGVFDSGIGGFSIVKKIFEYLPEYEVVYFGDVARFPYGNKTQKKIVEYSEDLYGFLKEKGMKVNVIACHTASAAAADVLRAKNEMPVFDVVSAGSKMGVESSNNRKIGVMATKGTVKSGKYIEALKSFGNVSVYQYQCPSLANLIEDAEVGDEVVKMAVESYLKEVKAHGIDTLILGCTHYPLIAEMIGEVVGDVKLIDPAEEVAKQVKAYFEQLNEDKLPTKGNNHRFYVSDYPQEFSGMIQRFLGKEVECEYFRF